MDDIKKTIWVAVDDNLEFSEHETMESALGLASLILFLEKEGTWKNGPYDNFAYDVDFYNKEGIKIDGLAMGDWRISNLRILDGGFSNNYYKTRVRFNIIDPWGTAEERNFGNRRSGITNAIVFLRAVSKYTSWAEFRKDDPVEKENSEINLLKGEVEQLKKKLEAIQEIVSTEIKNP